jgi:hypothetical protein
MDYLRIYSFDPNHVPEPGILALLGLGFGLMAVGCLRGRGWRKGHCVSTQFYN